MLTLLTAQNSASCSLDLFSLGLIRRHTLLFLLPFGQMCRCVCQPLLFCSLRERGLQTE